MNGKATVIPVLVLSFVLMICGCGTVKTSSGWHIKEVANLSGSSSSTIKTLATPVAPFGAQPSLAFTSDGKAHIAYCARDTGVLKYASFSNSTWEIVTVDTRDGSAHSYAGAQPCMVIDSSDHPHIVYWTLGSSSYHIKYAKHNGTTWESENIIDTGYGSFPSLKIGTDAKARIAFCSSNVVYGVRNGTTWETTVVSTEDAHSTRLLLDSNNIPHITYAVARKTLKHAWLSGSTWEVETVASINMNSVLDTVSSVMDGTGKIYIAYASDTLAPYDNSQVWYATNSSGAWVTENMYSTASGYEPSIALDSQNTVHIAHSGGINGGLSYSTKGTAGWSQELIRSNTSVSNQDVSLVVRNNQPKVAFYDSVTEILYYAVQEISTTEGW